MSQLFNRHKERLHGIAISNHHDGVARDRIAVQNFRAFLVVLNVIFGSVNERAAFERRHGRDGLARQESFRCRDAAKAVDRITNNFETILTTIQDGFFESVGFGGHDCFDALAAFQKMP